MRRLTVRRVSDLTGLALCTAAGLCLIAALAVDLESRAARVLMVVAAVCFAPGAVLALAFVRRAVGPPR